MVNSLWSWSVRRPVHLELPAPVLASIFLILVAACWEVVGQTTNTTCVSNTTTSWVFNEFGESPCLVWSQLQSLCLPPDGYINVPPLLNANWGYNPASDSDGNGNPKCSCNVVSYGLMAGCTWCQLGSKAAWTSEAEWSSGCSQYDSTGLGFTEIEIQIPAYAWMPMNGNKWDPNQASAAAPTYNSYPTTTYPTTLTRSLPAPTATTALPTTTTHTSSKRPSSTSSPNSNSNLTEGAIVPTPISSTATSDIGKWGGIVGGIAGGVTALVLVVLVLLRNRKKRGLPLFPGASKPTSTTPRRGRQGKVGGPSRHMAQIDTESATAGGGGGGGGGRETQIIMDPEIFNNPRTAPLPPENMNKLRYKTTPQRLKEEQANRPFSDYSSGAEDLYGQPLPLLPGLMQRHRDSMAEKQYYADADEDSVVFGDPRDGGGRDSRMSQEGSLDVTLEGHGGGGEIRPPNPTHNHGRQTKLRIRNRDLTPESDDPGSNPYQYHSPPLQTQSPVQDFTRTPRSAHYSASIVSLSGLTAMAREKRDTLLRQSQSQSQFRSQRFNSDNYGRNDDHQEDKADRGANRPFSPESRYPASTIMRPESGYSAYTYTNRGPNGGGRFSGLRDSVNVPPNPISTVVTNVNPSNRPFRASSRKSSGGMSISIPKPSSGTDADVVGLALGSAKDANIRTLAAVRESRSEFENRELPPIPELAEASSALESQRMVGISQSQGQSSAEPRRVKVKVKKKSKRVERERGSE